MIASALLSIICLAGATGLVVAEHRHAMTARIACKLLASSAFVAVAVERGATDSPYGRLLLAALVLSWCGDALLLSANEHRFSAGIAAFLLAHCALAGAFLGAGVTAPRLALGLVTMSIVGGVVLRWLWPHLSRFYQVAVTAYVAAIGAMVAGAIGGSASSPIGVPLGAIAFAASDIAVARDRFVAPAFINQAWGIPLYYAAQVLIANSIVSGTR